MPGCNIEDIFCQMNALSHLKGLKSVLGEERYREEFPELLPLEDKISQRETDLRAALKGCLEEPAPENPDEVRVKVNTVIEEEG